MMRWAYAAEVKTLWEGCWCCGGGMDVIFVVAVARRMLLLLLWLTIAAVRMSADVGRNNIFNPNSVRSSTDAFAEMENGQIWTDGWEVLVDANVLGTRIT